MKPPDARSLSPEAQQALRQRVIHALQAQHLRPAQAARLFGLHRATVARWWKAFQRHGPEALLSQRRGRKPKPLLHPDSRDADHLYHIKPHERRWIYAGVTSDHRQILMGLYCPNLVAIFFDEEGALLDVQQRVLGFMVEDAERGVGTSFYDIYDERIEPELVTWQEAFGFQPSTISIHKFFVLEDRRNQQENAWRRDGIGIVNLDLKRDKVRHSVGSACAWDGDKKLALLQRSSHEAAWCRFQACRRG
jgi:hypothetical protein